MPKNIFLCTDGTWMIKHKVNNELMPWSSNVAKIHEWIKKTQQLAQGYEPYYDPGVGTGADVGENEICKKLDKILGGITGKGLEKNIVQAYEHLSKNYKPGDNIFGFGFSRGAYTIRVVAGIVCKYGIPIAPNDCQKIYQECYRKRNVNNPYPCHRDNNGGICKEFYFLGVWDTVGALGIPFGPLRIIAKCKYSFMDLKLSNDVKHAVHAVSVDEKRRSFIPTLWTNIDSRSNVEQKWFCGDHCGVGGGHKDTGLSDITLKWMLYNLLRCSPFLMKPQGTIGVIYLNLSDFNPNIKGEIFTTNKKYIISRFFPHHRKVNNQYKHPTVCDRIKQVDGYLPKNVTCP